MPEAQPHGVILVFILLCQHLSCHVGGGRCRARCRMAGLRDFLNRFLHGGYIDRVGAIVKAKSTLEGPVSCCRKFRQIRYVVPHSLWVFLYLLGQLSPLLRLRPAINLGRTRILPCGDGLDAPFHFVFIQRGRARLVIPLAEFLENCLSIPAIVKIIARQFRAGLVSGSFRDGAFERFLNPFRIIDRC